MLLCEVAPVHCTSSSPGGRRKERVLSKASFIIGLLVIGFWAFCFIGPSVGFDYLTREDSEILDGFLMLGSFQASGVGVALGVWGLLLRKACRWAVAGTVLNLVPFFVMLFAPLVA